MYALVPDEMILLVVAPCLGYRTVGGIRASAYNAMPVEGCQSLGELHEGFCIEEGVTGPARNGDVLRSCDTTNRARFHHSSRNC